MQWREAVNGERLRRQLAIRHPALHFVAGTDVKLRGSILLEHRGVELDRFAVEIDLEPLREGELPTVREIGGRIPWVAERHINSDGSACVCLPEDYYLHNPGSFELLSFLDGAVRNFFLGQALVEHGEPWPNGEWKHGEDGCTEWRQKTFHELPRKSRRAYARLIEARELQERSPCPCGSGKTLRACHYALVLRLRRTRPPHSL